MVNKRLIKTESVSMLLCILFTFSTMQTNEGTISIMQTNEGGHLYASCGDTDLKHVFDSKALPTLYRY